MIELWKGAHFEGDPIELKWNRKDLGNLNSALGLVPGRDVAVQAGGCLGVFPKWLAREFGVVYTFEPSWELFPLLVRNAPEHNIVRFQAALGDGHAMVGVENEIRPNDGKTVLHPGMSYLVDGGDVPVLRIDDLSLRRCDLIYLDVEGHELNALRGAVGVIGAHRPVIAVEVNRGIKYVGQSEEEITTWLENMDYELKLLARSDQVWLPR